MLHGGLGLGKRLGLVAVRRVGARGAQVAKLLWGGQLQRVTQLLRAEQLVEDVKVALAAVDVDQPALFQQVVADKAAARHAKPRKPHLHILAEPARIVVPYRLYQEQEEQEGGGGGREKEEDDEDEEEKNTERRRWKEDGAGHENTLD